MYLIKSLKYLLILPKIHLLREIDSDPSPSLFNSQTVASNFSWTDKDRNVAASFSLAPQVER